MSDLGFNKIAFCVLGTALAVIGLNEASHAMFHHEEHEFAGYYVPVETGPVGPVVEGARGVGQAILRGPRAPTVRVAAFHRAEQVAVFGPERLADL